MFERFIAGFAECCPFQGRQWVVLNKSWLSSPAIGHTLPARAFASLNGMLLIFVGVPDEWEGEEYSLQINIAVVIVIYFNHEFCFRLGFSRMQCMITRMVLLLTYYIAQSKVEHVCSKEDRHSLKKCCICGMQELPRRIMWHSAK